MTSPSTTVAKFVDQYGDEREVHRTHTGLRVKRQSVTPALAMCQPIAEMVGARVKELRLERGWTLVELARAAGMGTGNPKQRIWRIENAVRGEGIRMGTLYALAMALGVEATDLMPPVRDVAYRATVLHVHMPTLDTPGG